MRAELQIEKERNISLERKIATYLSPSKGDAQQAEIESLQKELRRSRKIIEKLQNILIKESDESMATSNDEKTQLPEGIY